MNKPFFSIVMPLYNRESLIEEIIKSYCEQTFSDFELIIVDDCSTDNSYDKCLELAKDDQRIKPYKLDKNGGVAQARHFGNTKAEADIIVIADSDDFAYPNRLEELHKLYDQNPDASVCYTNLDLLYIESEKVEKRFFQPFNKELLYHINYIPNPSASYKKSAYFSVEGYLKNLKISEDYDLWLQFADKDYKFMSSPISTVRMLKHSGSIRIEKHNEHKDFINLVRRRHGITNPSLQRVKDLASEETYNFFSAKNKSELWFDKE